MEEIPQSTALLNIDSLQIQGLSEHLDGANEAMGELEQITNDEKVKLEETATEPAADAENDKNKSNKVPTEKEEGEDKEGSFFNKRVKVRPDEERSDELKTPSQAAKTARTRTSARHASPW
jgi:hypothetical protein